MTQTTKSIKYIPLTFYASAAAVLAALLFGGVDSHPYIFALCGIAFAVTAGIVLFKE